jgi:RHS repeat-associated protein
MERYEHDAAGRMIRRTRPDGTAAVYAYDLRGKLTGIKWDGDRAEPSTFAYDAAGRMTLAKNFSATVERTYTRGGRLETETQTITASFDGSQKTEFGSQESVIAYRHDADGRLAALIYPDGTEVRYTYNTRGELANVVAVGTDGAPSVAAAGTRRTDHRPLAKYDRRPDGAIAKLTMSNGLVTTRTYDEAGRLTEIKHTAPNGEVLESEASRYDVCDRRTARTGRDGTADLFSYDPAGQVVATAYGVASAANPAQSPNGTQASQPVPPAGVPPAEKLAPAAPTQSGTEKDGFTPTQTFAYDAAGNRLKTTDNGRVTVYVANANNQYTAISEDGAQHEPDYDKSGNLLHDATRKLTWDADIHLLAVETRAEGAIPNSAIRNPHSAIKESFRYDALHRRVARNESAKGTTTLFIHDGWNVIAEYETSPRLPVSPSPSLRAKHVWGEDLSRTLQGAGGIGGLLASTHFRSPERAQPASPTTDLGTPITALFLSYDSNGNVILLTDAACRAAARYRYDAFGQTLTASGPAATLNRYRFSTKPVEASSGLAYYGYRYYDPRTGRWPSRDPIEGRGGISLYGMLGNDLVDDVDILGRIPTGGGCNVACCTRYEVSDFRIVRNENNELLFPELAGLDPGVTCPESVVGCGFGSDRERALSGAELAAEINLTGIMNQRRGFPQPHHCGMSLPPLKFECRHYLVNRPPDWEP